MLHVDVVAGELKFCSCRTFLGSEQVGRSEAKLYSDGSGGPFFSLSRPPRTCAGNNDNDIKSVIRASTIDIRPIYHRLNHPSMYRLGHSNHLKYAG